MEYVECLKEATALANQLKLSEGYFLSDKTISVNLDDFKSGKKKKLLIIGLAGSGKSTIGEQLAKKMSVKWINIDVLYWRLKQKYFKNVNETKEEMSKKVREKIIEYLKSNEPMIIEGIDIIELYRDEPQYRKLILEQTFIILGLSLLRSSYRSAKRNIERGEKEGWFAIHYGMQKFNQKIQPAFELLRKDVIKKYGSSVEEYKIS